MPEDSPSDEFAKAESTRQVAPNAPNKPNEQTASPRFAIVAAVSLLLLVGMVSGSGLWVMVAAAAGMLLGLNYFIAKTWAQSVVTRRQGSDAELEVGQTLEVEVTLRNTSKIP